MRNPAWSHRNATRSDQMLGPLDVYQDLPLKHDESLVLVRMGVKRCRLASRHPILEQNECPVGLLSGRLPDVYTSAGKPEALSLSSPADDRHCSAHYSPPFARLQRAWLLMVHTL